jgi:hypothetical protein
MRMGKRQEPHRTIHWPPAKARAVKQVADLMGMTSEALIQRFIDVGLGLFVDVDQLER